MRYLFIVIIFFIFTGCSFKSPHARFIDNIEHILSDYNNYEKAKGIHTINDSNLVKITYDHNENTLYHFETHPKYCDDACRYYIVVNKDGIIIGWGFDPCDREKCCRIVG